jgi:hypothetical protein
MFAFSMDCRVGQPAVSRQMSPAGIKGRAPRAGSNRVAATRAKIQTKIGVNSGDTILIGTPSFVMMAGYLIKTCKKVTGAPRPNGKLPDGMIDAENRGGVNPKCKCAT